MEYKIFDKTVVLRLDKGDEIVSAIKTVCEKENVKLGAISGIGGTDNFTIGVFDLKKKQYDEKTFSGAYEITSIVGNVNTKDGKHYSHIHVNCSKKGGKTVGGHLISCHISLTAEIFISVLDGTTFKKTEKTVWICRNCGHIEDSATAPEKCPVCAHPQAYFELKVINY